MGKSQIVTHRDRDWTPSYKPQQREPGTSGLWNHHSRGLGRGQREWDQGPWVHLRVASGDLGYSRVSPLPFSLFTEIIIDSYVVIRNSLK